MNKIHASQKKFDQSMIGVMPTAVKQYVDPHPTGGHINKAIVLFQEIISTITSINFYPINEAVVYI